jgi:hypothetical protein
MRAIRIALSITPTLLVGWLAVSYIAARSWGPAGVVNMHYYPAVQTTCRDQARDTFVAFRRRGDAYELRCSTNDLSFLNRLMNGDGFYPFVRTVPAPAGWTPDQYTS